jgi:hypothetical protein
VGLACQKGADRDVDVEASKEEFTEVSDADSSRSHALFLVEGFVAFFSLSHTKISSDPMSSCGSPSMIAYEIYSFLSVA